jgi:hypothetical protein
MEENNRNQQQGSGISTKQNQGSSQTGQSENTSHKGNDQNPQNGGSWNNYLTRELSDEGTGEGNATTPRGE